MNHRVELEYADEEKLLLRDLLVYQISLYDALISQGNAAPYIARRACALELLISLNARSIYGDDGTFILFEDISRLCHNVPNEVRENLKISTLGGEGNVGLLGILSQYSNKVIWELALKLDIKHYL